MTRAAAEPIRGAGRLAGPGERPRSLVSHTARGREVASGKIVTGVAAAFWLACQGPAAATPAIGQALSDFEAAIALSLANRGDRMGYALQPCALKPPFAASGTTYLGRAFSERTDVLVVLVAVEAGRVSRWIEYDLPGFEGWFTHGVVRCRGSMLEVSHGRTVQRYRWTGQAFVRRR